MSDRFGPIYKQKLVKVGGVPDLFLKEVVRWRTACSLEAAADYYAKHVVVVIAPVFVERALSSWSRFATMEEYMADEFFSHLHQKVKVVRQPDIEWRRPGDVFNVYWVSREE